MITIGQLKQEVKEISKEIHEIQRIIEETTDNSIRSALVKKLEELRWQMLLYLEMIENMKEQ
ncbi:MAG: hypothetical protein N3B21_04855 [Clostridia bacterium]|nr:hypothetical protein [Clostridia bacterium]